MAVATFDQLRASGGVITEGRIKIATSLASKNLFLSHSHRDIAHLGAALGLLEGYGASVYVDVRDAIGGDPNQVAERLRKAVVSCRRLVALVTEATSTSRWIPWEMGLADGAAGSTQIALLPLRATGADALWAQQEYFDLYGRIEYVTLSGESAPCWAVRDPTDKKFWTLDQWMWRTTPPGRL